MPQLSDDESQIETTTSENTKRKQRKQKIDKDWQLETTFDTKEDAEASIKEDKVWSFLTKRETSHGFVKIFRCNQVPFRGTQCESGAKLLFNSDSQSVSKFISGLDHTCDKIGPSTLGGISGAAKDKMLELIALKLKAKAIHKELLKDGHSLTLVQVTNFYSRQKLKTNGNNITTLGELESFCLENIKIPESDDEAYVLDYWIDDNEIAPRFGFVMSTKGLLSLGLKTDNICADGTYKLCWENYNVLVAGNTDLARHFHPLGIAVTTTETSEDYECLFNAIKKGIKSNFDTEYAPKNLTSDAANAIANGFKLAFGENVLTAICYVHVSRNVEKKVNSDSLSLLGVALIP